jgi:hypothetical protein
MEIWRSEFGVGCMKFEMPIFNQEEMSDLCKLLSGGNIFLYQFRT